MSRLNNPYFKKGLPFFRRLYSDAHISFYAEPDECYIRVYVTVRTGGERACFEYVFEEETMNLFEVNAYVNGDAPADAFERHYLRYAAGLLAKAVKGERLKRELLRRALEVRAWIFEEC